MTIDKTTIKKTPVKPKPKTVSLTAVKKMIKEAVSSAKVEYEEQIKAKDAEIAELNKKSKKPSNFKVRISDDVEIELGSNVGGKFIIKNVKGKHSLFEIIDGVEDTVYVPYGEFRAYLSAGNGRKFLKNGKLIVKNVHDPELTIEDVVKSKDIFKLYDGKYKINDLEVLLNSGMSEFVKFANEFPETGESLFEYAHELYKKGEFNNGEIIAYLRREFHNDGIFK